MVVVVMLISFNLIMSGTPETSNLIIALVIGVILGAAASFGFHKFGKHLSPLTVGGIGMTMIAFITLSLIKSQFCMNREKLEESCGKTRI
jgi:uncharacterized membrane protein